jgi:RecA-family ATPase
MTVFRPSQGFQDLDKALGSYRDEFPQHGNREATTASRASQFFSASEWEGKPVPEREWLVPDLVPGKNVTLLSGDGGTGKSLVALQLAVSVAASRAWLGRPVEDGRVIYISAEDDAEELHRRTADIVKAEGLTFRDLSRLTIRSLAGEDALLAVETAVSLAATALMQEIHDAADTAPPKLIVLDTLADLYPANENDRAKVRAFVSMLRGLSLRHRCAVLLLSHPSLAGMSSGSGASGSTAWNNSVRSRLYLERVVQDGYEADPDKRVLSTKKANYGRTGGQLLMRWQDGAFKAEGERTGLDAMADNAKAERVFLSLLAEFTSQGRRVNHKGSSSYAPKAFADHPDSEGITKRPFRVAMERLLADGRIGIQEEGPASRRVQYLVLK